LEDNEHKQANDWTMREAQLRTESSASAIHISLSPS